MEYRYYVIKFLVLPADFINSAVCVPKTWIKFHNSGERHVLFAYPVEEPLKTKERVKNFEICDKSWRNHWGTVEYGADDYQDAETWITSGGIAPNDNNNDPGYIGAQSRQDTELVINGYQKNTPSTADMQKSQASDVSTKNSQNISIKLSLKRKLQSNNADEFYVKQPNIVNVQAEQQGTEGQQEMTNYLTEANKSHSRLIHQQNINQEPSIQENTRAHQNTHQTSIHSAVRISSNSHNDFCQPINKTLQNAGIQNEHIVQNTNINRNNHVVYTDTSSTNIPPTTTTNMPPNQSNQFPQYSNPKRISVVPSEYLFHNHSKREFDHERLINTNKCNEKVKLAHPLIQTFKNSPKYSYQSPEYPYPKHVPGFSNGYYFSDGNKADFNTRNTTPATSLTGQYMKDLRENQSKTTEGNYQESHRHHRQQVIGRSHRIYHPIVHPEDVSKNNLSHPTSTKFPQQLQVNNCLPHQQDFSPHLYTNNNYKQNVPNMTNQPCQLTDSSRINLDTGYNVHVHINKIVVSNSTELNRDDPMEPENVTRNVTPIVKNISNFVTEATMLHEKPQQVQNSSGYKVIVQQDPLINKIIITRSEMEGDSETVPLQSNSQQSYTMQNNSNGGESCQSSNQKREGKIPLSFSGVPNRTTPTSIPHVINDYLPEKVKRISSDVQHCVNFRNQSSQFVPQNYPVHTPQTERTIIGKTVATDRCDLKPRLQNIRKPRIVCMQNLHSLVDDRLGQINDKQSLPIGKNHSLQNSTEIHNNKQSNNIDNYNQRTYLHDISKKSISGIQFPPRISSYSTPEQLQNSQVESVYNKYQEPRVHVNHYIGPTLINTTNQKAQNKPHNMSAIQNVQNRPTHSCCSCKCSNAKQTAPVVQDLLYEDTQLQKAGGHFIKQMIHSQTNLDDKLFNEQDCLKISDQTNSTIPNQTAECFIPDLQDPLAIDTCTQKLSATTCTIENCAIPIYVENKSEGNHSVLQTSPNMPNQQSPSANHHPLTYKHTSDGDIEVHPEEIYIEETLDEDNNNINYIEENISKNNTLIQSLSHDTSNEKEHITVIRNLNSDINNMANSNLLSEQALLNDLKSMFTKMDSNLCKTHSLINNANQIFAEYTDSYKKTIQVVNKYYELKINEAAASMAMKIKKSKDKRHKKNRPDKHRNDDRNDTGYCNNNT